VEAGAGVDSGVEVGDGSGVGAAARVESGAGVGSAAGGETAPGCPASGDDVACGVATGASGSGLVGITEWTVAGGVLSGDEVA
jgi:hypothetical protein